MAYISFTNNQLIKFLNKLTIKRLTILGFALVITPLIASILYSALQVNLLSKQSTEAIFNAAELISTNRELTENRIKLERYASQYLVLNDNEILNNFFEANQKVYALVERLKFNTRERQLVNTANTLQQKIKNVEQQLSLKQKNSEVVTLAALQPNFVDMAKLNNEITTLIDIKIKQQANNIKASAEHINFTILNSLIIIPISLLIAAAFIFLISTPLKIMRLKIKRLEKGNFKHKIAIKGSAEITDIANALDIMRQRLQALELQKSSFLRHISHELKTPLAAIKEGAELLYEDAVGELNKDQHEISEIIRMNGAKLQRLIEDLLDFNVVLDSTSLQDTEQLNLTRIVNHVLSERKLDIKRKNLTIELTMPAIEIISNQKQITVILDNLLSNAIKYSPINGMININAECVNHQLNMTITDQGMGIEQSIQQKIFEAFYQGPAPENEVVKSSGLGLTIVKELIMRLNGDIQLTSKTKKPSGTTITIMLPKAHELKELKG